MLKTRVLTALVLVVLFLIALFWLTPHMWMVFAGALVLPAAWEWGGLSKLGTSARALYTLLVAIVCATLAALAVGEASATWAQARYAVYLAACLFWIVIVPAWLWRAWLPRSRWAIACVGLVVLVPTWLAMADLRSKAAVLLLLLMAVAWVSDIAAYFAGRRFGRRKLAPAISPGKTWEGVAGAVAAIAAYTALWAATLPDYFPPLLQVGWMGKPGMLLFLLLLTVAGIYGDLFESALKRRAGVKDSGKLLPGHGGVLDRIDALTAVLPLAALAYLL